MKKESMIGRRLYAFLIDVVLFAMLTFLFDAFVSTNIMKATTNIDTLYQTYETHSKEYNNKQVEYGLYYYNDKEELVFNENATKEQQNAFLADPVVVSLRESLPEEQKVLVIYFVVRVIISIAITSFLTFFVLPLCLRRGRTLGKLIAKLSIVSKDYSYITWYKLLLRYFISAITNIFLFILTLGILPLIHFIFTLNHKENQALYDLACKTYVIDGKVPSIILKETSVQTEE